MTSGPVTIAEIQRRIEDHEERDVERFAEVNGKLEVLERLIQKRLDIMLYTIVIIALGVFGKEFVLQIIDKVMSMGMPQ